MQYSIVVPIYNDAYLAQEFCQKIAEGFSDLSKPLDAELEVIFVNDGSRIDSERLLDEVARSFPFVKVFHLSRNFGQHIAISCGFKESSGRMIGYLNVDLEDPIDQLRLLFDHLSNHDVDCVHGLYSNRSVSWSNKVSSLAFNWVLSKLTGYDVPSNTSTVRVYNRRFIDAYNSLNEKQRFLPGLESWLGFKHDYVPVIHQPRKRGKSSYNFRRRILMATTAIIAFSDWPLKITSYFGMFIAVCGSVMGFVLVVNRLLGTPFQAGYTSTIALIVFLGGLQIFVTGLASLYIGQILRETQNRPLYFVRRTSEERRQ